MVVKQQARSSLQISGRYFDWFNLWTSKTKIKWTASICKLDEHIFNKQIWLYQRITKLLENLKLTSPSRQYSNQLHDQNAVLRSTTNVKNHDQSRCSDIQYTTTVDLELCVKSTWYTVPWNSYEHRGVVCQVDFPQPQSNCSNEQDKVAIDLKTTG